MDLLPTIGKLILMEVVPHLVVLKQICGVMSVNQNLNQELLMISLFSLNLLLKHKPKFNPDNHQLDLKN